MQARSFRIEATHVAIILGVCLLAVIVTGKVALSKLKGAQVIHVAVFNRVATLPNHFVLEVGTAETALSAAHGRVVIGSDLAGRKEFIEYMRRHAVEEGEKCGLTMIESTDKNVRSTLLHNSADFMLFVNVPSETEEVAINSICSGMK